MSKLDSTPLGIKFSDLAALIHAYDNGGEFPGLDRIVEEIDIETAERGIDRDGLSDSELEEWKENRLDEEINKLRVVAETKLREHQTEFGELWEADPDCWHEEDPNCYSGVKCLKCKGWMCL